MNFNYTDTLERIYDIPEDKILYIHGKALRDDKLIVGHHAINRFQEGSIPAFNAPEEHGKYLTIEDEDVRIVEALEIIKDYFRVTYKDTESIIEKNRYFFKSLADITEVFILGHSLSDIDMEYFVKVRECVSPWCRWYISYYSEDDKCNIEWLAKKLNIEVSVIQIPNL